MVNYFQKNKHFWKILLTFLELISYLLEDGYSALEVLHFMKGKTQIYGIRNTNTNPNTNPNTNTNTNQNNIM